MPPVGTRSIPESHGHLVSLQRWPLDAAKCTGARGGHCWHLLPVSCPLTLQQRQLLESLKRLAAMGSSTGQGSEDTCYPVFLVFQGLVRRHSSKGGLETSLDTIVLQKDQQWISFMIFNVSQNSSMRCYFWCSGKLGSKRLNIGVFYLPKQVLLKLQPTRVAVGSPFTIECRVPSVAPLEGLTVTLLRGSEVLHSQTFEGTALSPQEAMVTYSAEAQLEDSSHNFSCQAKMDLRTRGVKVVDSVSDSQALEVFEPVQDNWMVIIVVLSVLLFLVTSVLLCFVFGQQGNHRRRGAFQSPSEPRPWAPPC
ncbi:intercellular adhesion molecule 2 [Camelus ferus]|nr:intercellular adhesion molecule 2 [Camelus ferus]